jgi:hypothetical protein
VRSSALPLFAETLGAPFRRRTFSECAPEDLPFTAPIGTRGWLVTFAFQFLGAESSDQGLLRDLDTLSKLELSTCRYGASDTPVLPFMCELRAGQQPLTEDVLAGLDVHDFRSATVHAILKSVGIDRP